MTCELSSSFSQENRLTGSTQVWAPQTLPVGNFYFGASTKVVPYNDSVYTFVGQPGAQAHWSNTHPARNYDDQGSIFIFKSGSSGFEQEIVIGPSGSANPNQNQPSNYLAINPTSSGGAPYFTSDYAIFGKSIDAVSSSAGLHFAVAAPGMANYAGRILLFQSSSNGIEMLEDPGEQLTGSQDQPLGATVGLDSTTYSQAGTHKYQGNYSDRTAISYGGYGIPNDAVSIMFDDEEENLYVSFYDSLLSDAGEASTTGGIRLYKSSSLGGIEHLKDITVSSPITNEQVGSAHQMIVADGKIYIAASGYAIPRDPGQAYLFTYDISAGTYTEDIYYPASSFSDPDGEVYTENFGSGTPDIVSGSDGIYILQGSGKRHDTDPYTPYDGLGRLYLFKSSSSGISTVSSFTGSNDDDEYGYNFFGGTAQIMSGNSGLVIVSSEYSGALVGSDTWATASPRIWVYETGSNLSTSYYIGTGNSTEISNISPTTPTMGRVLDAQISNDGETLHLATSDPTWSGNEGATFLYGWGLSGSCSQQQQQGDNNMSTSDKRGIAVYSGSSGAVHKFLDDGSSVIGTDGDKLHAMSGNLTIDSSATYDIEAQGDVSASAYHGDGSNLTNINATPDISESSADFYFVGAAAIGSDQSLVGESDRGPVFAEASKQMRVHAFSASGDADLNGALNVQGAATLQSNMSASGDVYGENLYAGMELDVGGGAFLQDTLDVTGDATFSTVSASSTLQAGGALTVSGNADLNGQLDVEGAATLQSTLDAGATTVASLDASDGGITNAGAIAGATNIDASGDLTVGTITNAEFTVAANGNTDIDGTLNAEGDTTLQNSLDVGGLATFSDIADFEARVDAQAGMDVTGSVNITTDLSVAGDASADSLAITNNIDANTITASAGLEVGTGELYVGETSYFGGDMQLIGAADFDSTLDVQGAANFQAATDHEGGLTSTTISASGDAELNGALDVAGNATFDGNITLGDAATDKVEFKADISSSMLPSDDGVFDLGAVGSEWNDLYIDGTANIDSLVADTADINGGTIDGATIATSDVTVGAGKTLNVSAGTLTTSAAQKEAIMEGAAADIDIGAYSLTAETLVSDVTTGTAPLTVTSTTKVDNLNVDKLDGSDWASPADLGSTSPAAVYATTLSATGNITLGDAATDKVEFKADISSSMLPSDDGVFDLGAVGSEWNDLYIDGTANIDSLVADTADINGGSVDGATIGAASQSTGKFTTLSGSSTLDMAGAATFNSTLDAQATTVTSMSASAAIQGGSTIAVAGNADLNGDLDVAGDSTLGTNNADSVVVNGHLRMGSFDGENGDDQTTLNTMATTPANYNGAMIYVSNAYNSTGPAAFYFDNANKWYFCENGDWFPSPFNS